MSSLIGHINLRVEVRAHAVSGQPIDMAADQAAQLAALLGERVILIHNDTEVICEPGDQFPSIVQDWDSLRRQDQRRRGIK